MGRQYVAASSEYDSIPAPFTAPPFVVSCWVRMDALAVGGAVLWCLTDASATNHYFALWARGTGVFSFSRRGGGGGNDFVDSAAYATDGTWQHVLCIVRSTTDVEIRVDNADVGTDTDAHTITGIDEFVVGALVASGDSFHSDTIVANVGMWDQELTEGEYTQLAAGMKPDAIATAPVRFIEYNTETPVESITGATITTSGTPDWELHPRSYSVDPTPVTTFAAVTRDFSDNFEPRDGTTLEADDSFIMVVGGGDLADVTFSATAGTEIRMDINNSATPTRIAFMLGAVFIDDGYVLRDDVTVTYETWLNTEGAVTFEVFNTEFGDTAGYRYEIERVSGFFELYRYTGGAGVQIGASAVKANEAAWETITVRLQKVGDDKVITVSDESGVLIGPETITDGGADDVGDHLWLGAAASVGDDLLIRNISCTWKGAGFYGLMMGHSGVVGRCYGAQVGTKADVRLHAKDVTTPLVMADPAVSLDLSNWTFAVPGGTEGSGSFVTEMSRLLSGAHPVQVWNTLSAESNTLILTHLRPTLPEDRFDTTNNDATADYLCAMYAGDGKTYNIHVACCMWLGARDMVESTSAIVYGTNLDLILDRWRLIWPESCIFLARQTNASGATAADETALLAVIDARIADDDDVFELFDLFDYKGGPNDVDVAWDDTDESVGDHPGVTSNLLIAADMADNILGVTATSGAGGSPFVPGLGVRGLLGKGVYPRP